MSDLVIVSKSEIERLLYQDVNDIKVDIRAILDKATPVSGEAVGKIVYDRKVDDKGHIYDKCRPQLWQVVTDAKLLSCEYGTKLYTTPQPAMPEGYALVPIEPTEEWIQQTCLRKSNTKCNTYEEWKNSHEFLHSTTVAKFRELVIADYKAMITEAMKGE